MIEKLTPIAFLIAGALSLYFQRHLRVICEQEQLSPKRQQTLEALLERFDRKAHLSWALIVMGFLWLLQNFM